MSVQDYSPGFWIGQIPAMQLRVVGRAEPNVLRPKPAGSPIAALARRPWINQRTLNQFDQHSALDRHGAGGFKPQARDARGEAGTFVSQSWRLISKQGNCEICTDMAGWAKPRIASIRGRWKPLNLGSHRQGGRCGLGGVDCSRLAFGHKSGTTRRGGKNEPK